jgi:hypothetical protein
LLVPLEGLARVDAATQGYLDDLGWPKLQWARMVFLGLWEANFERVPPWVHTKVLAAWRGFTTTKPTEDLNRVMRVAEDDSNANRDLGRARRWYATVTSKVLEECDRGRVAISQAAKAAATRQKPSPELFDPEVAVLFLTMPIKNAWLTQCPPSRHLEIEVSLGKGHRRPSY